MPKMKTHRGAAKRVKRTGSGQLKRDHSKTSHLFANKTTKVKRKLRKPSLISHSDIKRVRQMLDNLK
jgi:large subunit ribosomal protein L35